ncbi:crossover junction endonuclease EME1-like [Miscanthus floridulus]|uniref:crossover junction endonuclease EME1-like n=1 Tax=Miscanthus floridulus TaxID=154761 RepID=UPI0034585C73
MASSVPVVDILDDDDDDNGLAVASPPSCKRSLGSSGISSRDFLDAFSPSPPRHKRPLPAAEGPINLDDTLSPPKRRRSSVSIDLDDTPSPPKRQLSSVPMVPVLVVDEDVAPSAPGDVVTDRPDSIFDCAAFSESPETVVPSSAGLGSVDVETPGFASPRSVRPPAAPGMSSAPPAQKGSGVTSLISLDSDDESDDDIMNREPSINLPSNTEAMMCQKDDDAQHVQAKQKRQPAGKKLTKEEKDKLMQERKQKRQEDKLRKQALKDKLANKKKMEKAIQKWESGKLALECITVEIDNSVIQRGFIGGPLLSSLTENGLSYEPTKNKISGSILWKLDVPDDIAQAFSDLKDSCDMNQNPLSEVKYVAIVLEAEEFCNLISNGLFFDHVQRVRDGYPGFTICYIINKLMNYVNKCEQSQYKNHLNTWRRPPVEEVLCKLATHYINVHSRQCIDEAEVVEHLVGLTSSLAKCKFRKPITWLSVHANGAIIPKSFVHKNLAKNDTWLKALIAIPDIQPRYAIAIWKKYPCMRSLLNEYMDASKTVAEKERLLSDLKWEDRLGDECKRLGDKCSRRVYRMLMAQNGGLDTDDPEAGGRA